MGNFPAKMTISVLSQMENEFYVPGSFSGNSDHSMLFEAWFRLGNFTTAFGTLFLDFKKTFDCVRNQKLLEEIQNCRIKVEVFFNQSG